MKDQIFHLVPKKEKGTLLTPLHKTFNRLRAKIKTLQTKEQEITQELDKALQFYYEKIRPEEIIFQNALAECIKLAYQFYKTQKHFTKAELEELKEIIIDDVDLVCKMCDGCDIPAEIKEIFKELNGICYEEMAAEELEFLKNEMQEKFKKQGIDIDLSDINANNSQDEIMRKLFHSIGKAAENRENSHQEIPKTKKQQEKELKKKAFEEIQKKSLSDIYKNLARVLHPDLEQDGEQRMLKEGLMMKLTDAYQRNDLYELLNLEMEWFSHSTDGNQFQSNEQFEIYNAILKDQVKTLQVNIDMLLTHPRYMPIQRFYDHYFDGILTLKISYVQIKDEARALQALVLRLKTTEAKKILKAAIKEKREMRKIESLLSGATQVTF